MGLAASEELPTLRVAELTITVSGRAACEWLGGCQAALAIEPTIDPAATLDPGGPAPEGIALDLVQVEEADRGTYDVGPGADLPTTIEPGAYRVVGEWNLMSDIPSAGTFPIMGTQYGCVAPLSVEFDDHSSVDHAGVRPRRDVRRGRGSRLNGTPPHMRPVVIRKATSLRAQRLSPARTPGSRAPARTSAGAASC